jgi:hypothetical integral membrane protein (TIGR02206 family)
LRGWGSLNTFQPYTQKHLIVLVVTAAAIAFVCIAATLLSQRARGRFEKTLGVGLLLVWFFGAAWDVCQPGASIRSVLPLHWCDLTGILAGVVLLWPRDDTRAALHMWGLCFTAIAFVAPVENRGPAFGGFWAYFVPHGVILLAVAYDAFVRGYRPAAGDVWRVGTVTLAWVIAVTPFNLFVGGNYAYVGNAAAGQRTQIEAFGPWPGRVVTLYLTSLAVMTLIVLVQHLLRRPAAVPVTLRLAGTDAEDRPTRMAA